MTGRIGTSPWIGLAAAASAVLVGLPWTLRSAARESEKSPRDSRCESYLASGFPTLTDLIATFQERQYDSVILVPPGLPHFLFDDGLRCVDWKGFPNAFRDGLTAVFWEGVPVWPVTIEEEVPTRQYVFRNADGREFYRVGPAPGYDPRWVLLAHIPDFDAQSRPVEERAVMEALYDPARVVARYVLIGSKELRAWLSAQAAPEAGQDTAEGAGRLSAMGAGGSGGPDISNLVFTVVRWASNALDLELSYPVGFTNRVDIFSVDGETGLPRGVWTLRVTTNVHAATNYLAWTDATASGITTRFYVAANADVTPETDPDGDGLPWGREKYLYGSSPLLGDTDGDGLNDYQEAVVLRTDPCNPDTNRPTVWMVYPADTSVNVWMP